MAEKRATLLIQLRDLASKGLSKLGRNFDRMSKNFNRSKFIFAAVGAGLSAIGALALKAAGDFEQWRIAFTTMLNSADRADILLNKIKQFAKETPFDLPQVVKGGRALLAFGVAAADVIPTMKSLGDVSAGLGVPMERLILNFGQVKAQAKLTGRELRDFAVAGVPLLAVLAKNLNKTQAEITEMVSAGKIGFPEVEAAFKSMSGEGGRFANLMKKQMDSIQGKFSNVKDVAFQLGVQLGNVFLPIAKKVADVIIQVGNKLLEMDEATKKNVVIVAALTTAVAGLTAGLGAFIAISGPLIAAFSVLFTVIAPIVAIVGILAFTILGLKDDFIILKDAGIEAFDKLKEKAKGLLEVIKLSLPESVKALFTVFKLGFDEVSEKAGEFKEKVVQDFTDLKEGSVNRFNEMKEVFVKNLGSMLKALKKQIKDALKLKKVEKIEEGKIEAKAEKETVARETRLAKFREFLNSKRVKNFETVLGQISSLSSAKNKELQIIGKAAAISLATINTLQGMTLALATIPPPFGFAAAAAVGAAGFVNVAKIAGVQLQEGGIIPARAGGTLATIGEGDQDEAVIPLDDAGGFGLTINFNGPVIGGEENVREFAKMIDVEFADLRRNNESVAFGFSQ